MADIVCAIDIVKYAWQINLVFIVDYMQIIALSLQDAKPVVNSLKPIV